MSMTTSLWKVARYSAAWRSAVTWISCEPDLIVGHDVDRTLGRVVGQLRHVERLVDNALLVKVIFQLYKHIHRILKIYQNEK